MAALGPVLRTLCRYLNDNELFYVFTGELALRMLGGGEEVGTIELTVNLTQGERERLLGFLEHEGFVVEQRWQWPVALRHRESGLGLKVRLAGSQADMAAIGRRVPVTLEYERFFIPATEDLLLGLLQEGPAPDERAARLYSKWRDHLDLEYLVASARSRGLYDRFIRMKMRADR